MSSRIDELAEDFLKAGLYLRGWSKTTLRTYRQAFGSLNRFGLKELSKSELEKWVIWLKENNVSAGGCNMYIRTINSFCSWLKEENHIETPLQLKLLKNPQKPISGFNENEVRLILAFRPRSFVEFRTWTLITTLLDMGIRIEEALTIRTLDLDLNNTVCKVVGKGNKIRIVPLSIEHRKNLFRYQIAKAKHSISEGYVFCTLSGHRLSYRNTFRDIANLCKKAGITSHVHPHRFRHTYAQFFVKRGGSIYHLSRILGHNSISTTQLYCRGLGVEDFPATHSLSPLVR